jgi:hypothetical protein
MTSGQGGGSSRSLPSSANPGATMNDPSSKVPQQRR